MVMKVFWKTVASRSNKEIPAVDMFPDVIFLWVQLIDVEYNMIKDESMARHTVSSIFSTTLTGTFREIQSFAGERVNSSSLKPNVLSHVFTAARLSGCGATSSSTSSLDKCCPYRWWSGSLTS